jgi:hypothetical protein
VRGRHFLTAVLLLPNRQRCFVGFAVQIRSRAPQAGRHRVQGQFSLKNIRSIVRKAYLIQAEVMDAVKANWELNHDDEFAAARNVLDRKMKTLQNTIGDAPIQAKPFTRSQIDELFASVHMSLSTPRGLLNRLYLVIGLSMAARVEWHVVVRFSSLSPNSLTENCLRHQILPIGVDNSYLCTKGKYGSIISRGYFDP